MNTALVHSFAKELGSRCISNDDLTKWMDTSDEWITQRSGIKTRYWVEDTVQTSDLATSAARQSLALSGNKNIDAIIAATLSPDHYFPGIGVLVQTKLGLAAVPAFDIRQQCSGFIYGLEFADSLIRSGKYKRILLVGAEIHSRGMDLSTRGRDLAVLFGDGAGSCIIEDSAEIQNHTSVQLEVLGSELHSDGSFITELWCELPGSVAFMGKITEQMISDGRIFAKMNGRKVFESAIKRMTEVSLSLLKKLGVSTKEISLFVPHQANFRINQMVAHELGLNDSQVFSTIQKYGNTTAATIPIGMTDAVNEGRIKKGDLVLQAAFGSGFTWGAALLRAR